MNCCDDYGICKQGPGCAARKTAAEATDQFAWECNECGSQEYTQSVSESDVHDLGCSACGASEWHLAKAKN